MQQTRKKSTAMQDRKKTARFTVVFASILIIVWTKNHVSSVNKFDVQAYRLWKLKNVNWKYSSKRAYVMSWGILTLMCTFLVLSYLQ